MDFIAKNITNNEMVYERKIINMKMWISKLNDNKLCF